MFYRRHLVIIVPFLRNEENNNNNNNNREREKGQLRCVDIYIYIHIYNLLRDSNEFSSWIFDWPILKLLGIVCIPINC